MGGENKGTSFPPLLLLCSFLSSPPEWGNQEGRPGWPHPSASAGIRNQNAGRVKKETQALDI